MLRTADGTDPNIIKRGPDGASWVPDDCGATFDDVDHMVTHPHDRIPTREESEEAWRRFMERRPAHGDEGHYTIAAEFIALLVAAFFIVMVVGIIALSWHDADIRRCQTAIQHHVPWSAQACDVYRP